MSATNSPASMLRSTSSSATTSSVPRWNRFDTPSNRNSAIDPPEAWLSKGTLVASVVPLSGHLSLSGGRGRRGNERRELVSLDAPEGAPAVRPAEDRHLEIVRGERPLLARELATETPMPSPRFIPSRHNDSMRSVMASASPPSTLYLSSSITVPS